MSLEKVVFITEELGPQVLNADGFNPVADDGSLWVDNYVERQFLPTSVYDEHQEALFITGIQEIDAQLAEAQEVQQTAPFLESERAIHVAKQLACLRSSLVTHKVAFEMRRNRGDIAGWLVSDITDYDDKLDLLDQALGCDKDAAFSVLLKLGDLRQDAEERANIRDLMEYLMVEMKHGMNLFANSRAIAILLQDKNLFSGVNDSVTKNHLEKSATVRFQHLLYQHARKLVGTPEEAYADELAAVDPEAKQALEIYRDTYSRCKTENTRVVNGRELRKGKRHVDQKVVEFLDIRNKQSFTAKQLAFAYLRYPQCVVDDAMLNRVNGVLSREGTSSLLSNIGTSPPSEDSARADAYLRALSECFGDHISLPPPSERSSDELKQSYADEINAGIIIYIPRFGGDYAIPERHDSNILRLFDQASSLCIAESTSDSSELTPYLQLHAELDIIEAEMESDSRVRMLDAVDQSRHRQKFNQGLTTVFEKLEQIHFASERIRLLARLMDIQKEHDTSIDSSYKRQKETLQKTADICKSNPIAALSINEDEIAQILGRHIELDTSRSSHPVSTT